MTNVYSVRVKIIADKPLSHRQLEELVSYLEVRVDDTNVRAEITYYKPIKGD